MERKYKYDLFLSFSNKDINDVKPIWEKLTGSGLNVFFFKESLKGEIGRYFDQAIENALEQSRDFVLICTPNSMQSEWIEAEYRTFFNEFYMKSKKRRRLIILEGRDFNIALIPLMMRRLQIAKTVDDIIDILTNKEGKGKEEIQVRASGESKLSSSLPKVSITKAKKIKKALKILLLLVFLSILIVTAIFLIKGKGTVTSPGKVTKTEPGKLYVTNITFMDIQTHATMARTELGALIDHAVVGGMNLERKSNGKIVINDMGQTRLDTDKNAVVLANITFDPSLAKGDKIDMIIKKIMVPNRVDVIVSGQYIEDSIGSMVTIRPLLIIKNKYYIRYIPLQFKKSEIFCQDPRSKKKILCQIVFDRIAGAVKELLDEL